MMSTEKPAGLTACGMNHEELLIHKGDLIDNAAYALAVALLRTSGEAQDEEVLPWDMSLIGPIVDAAEELLQNLGRQVCRPFNNGDELPCHLSGECMNEDCPLATIRERIEGYVAHNLSAHELDGVEITKEDLDSIEDTVADGKATIQEACDEVLSGIRDCLDAGLGGDMDAILP